MNDAAIKVLIVDDSRAIVRALKVVLAGFDVVGAAYDGASALRLEQELRPDVITMDLELPDASGLDLIRTILARRHVPIIVISSRVRPDEQSVAFEALRAGAYDVAAKTRFFADDGQTLEARKLVALVRVAAFSGQRTRSPGAVPTQAAPVPAAAPRRPRGDTTARLLAIGASTGGPAALQTILGALPAAFPLPVVVAQHMASGFTDGFVRWLDGQCQLKVEIATDRQPLLAGHVYFPPSDHNITVAEAGRVRVSTEPASDYVPSVDLLFASAVQAYGAGAVYLLLTGMGADGARSMLEAKRRGATTAVQDEATSTVYGMPRSAQSLGAADVELPLSEIAGWLLRQARGGR